MKYLSILDENSIFFIVLKIACFGYCISTLEYLFAYRDFKEKGIFSWDVMRSRTNFFRTPLRYFNYIFTYYPIIFFLVAAVVSCILILGTINPTVIKIGLAIIVLGNLVLSFRQIVGNDGADQFYSVLFFSLLIGLLFDTPHSIEITLYFIALQCLLSYIVAGLAKLLSPKWRNGEAILQITRTRTYGNNLVYQRIKGLPVSYHKFLNWKIIVIEVVFPFSLFFNFYVFLVFITWGLLFHFYNAIVMGLNNFFWAFLAAYPAIIYLYFQINPM